MTAPARIDAHQHFWALSRGDYGWLTPALAPIYRDFQPADLQPLLDRCGVSQTVLVQAAPSLEETMYLLSLADRHDVIAGVVGWVDLAAPDVDRTLRRLAAHRAFKGVRPMLQDLPAADWIASAPLDAAVEALAALDLRFDALVRPAQLPHLNTFTRRHPALPVVIDHAAKPAIARGDFAAWRMALEPLAAQPQVHCKLSGLLTEAGPGATAEALRPVVDALLELFGPERLIWGSDWPVLTLAAPYADWVAMTETLLADLSIDQRAAVWGGNARRFYRL